MIAPPPSSNNTTISFTTNRRNFILPKCIPTFRSDTVGGVHPIILTSMYAVTMVAIIVSNLLLVVGICKTRKKNKLTNSNKLFLFLCASDLLTGCVLMPLQIYYIHLVPNITCVQVGVRAFWSSFPLILSGTNILVITLDRYLMMVKNHCYRKWFSGKYVLFHVLLLEIAVSFGWALWYVFGTQTLDANVSAALFIGLCLYQILLLMSVFILNLKMVYEVKLSRRNTTLTNNNRAEKVLSKTITLISIALVICYTPSTIATGVAGFYALYSKNRLHLNRVTTILVYCLVPMQINSALNAIIYLVRNSRIRGYYKRLCAGEENTSPSDGYDTNDSLASHRGAYRYSTKKHHHTFVMGQRSNNTSQASLHKNGEINGKAETTT